MRCSVRSLLLSLLLAIKLTNFIAHLNKHQCREDIYMQICYFPSKFVQNGYLSIGFEDVLGNDVLI